MSEALVKMALTPPLGIFVGDEPKIGFVKTGCGLVEWRADDCAGQLRLSPDAVDLGVPDLDLATLSASIKTLVIGVAPRGGMIPAEWQSTLVAAARQGINIASGLHQRLADLPELVAAAKQSGAQLWDVRIPPADIPVGNGRKRPGKRLLTVGTDCVAGKKYTALAIARAMEKRAIPSDFRATGQTGIMIAGQGIPIDAVVCDFLSGAAEIVSPDNAADHWDVIEGQGSLFHPSYAGVALGLLHGSQPDAIVVCHNLARNRIIGLEDFPVPSIARTIERNLEAGALTNAAIRCVGISLNRSGVDSAAFEAAKEKLEREFSIPCFDPLIDGVEALVDRAMADCA